MKRRLSQDACCFRRECLIPQICRDSIGNNNICFPYPLKAVNRLFLRVDSDIRVPGSQFEGVTKKKGGDQDFPRS